MVVVVCIVFGVIVAMIASSKGRNPVGWFFYGALLFIVAIIHVLLIKPTPRHAETVALDSGGKKCPRCAEIVKREAAICRFFTHDFVASSVGA